MDRSTTSNDAHQVWLERGRGIYKHWNRYYEYTEPLTASVRAEAINQLDLGRGTTVLDIGCGPGSNFGLLREAVGPSGRVVGVDYSPEMVQRAANRIDEHGWENVEVVRADATRMVFEREEFDGAVATTALSAMPDVRAAVENVHTALCPGGRFAVYDVRLIQNGAGRVLNPLIALFYKYAGNWNSEEDVPEALQTVFEALIVGKRLDRTGTNYIVVARKPSDADL